MPTALLKITQGATTDVAGNAVIGALGTAVVFSNGDDTDVVEWDYALLDVPPPSGIAPFTQEGATATFNIGVPDARGSYRVRLTVIDALGNEDTDIRNFVVPFTNGIIAPPYQGDPPPLPLSGTGAKPDEMNVGGQAKGWAGDDDVSRPLMYQVLERVDAIANAADSTLAITGGVADTVTLKAAQTSVSIVAKVTVIAKTAAGATTQRFDREITYTWDSLSAATVGSDEVDTGPANATGWSLNWLSTGNAMVLQFDPGVDTSDIAVTIHADFITASEP